MLMNKLMEIILYCSLETMERATFYAPATPHMRCFEINDPEGSDNITALK